MSLYFSGQGKCYVATQVAGVPGQFTFIGNVPNLKITLKTEVIQHQEAQTGNRLEDLRITKSLMAMVDFTLEEYITDNLVAALYGSAPAMSGSSVTNEILPVLPAPITAAAVAANGEAGLYVKLAQQNVSSLVIHDSTGTPLVLTAGTDYSLIDAPFGTVQFLPTMGAFVSPLKASYTSGAVAGNTPIFTSKRVERWVRFVGLNTANNNQPVMIEMYRVSLDPAKELNAINDALNKLELNGSALYDTNIANADTAGVLGGFGRIMTLAAS